jgi:heme/copper-type cytochrome/quinol oxidase subunit 2
MDLIYFLTSVNKLSLVAFFFTLALLIYEVILFRKEAQRKSKPKIPNFQENISMPLTQAPTITVEKSVKITRPNNLILIVLIVLVILFGLATYFGFSHTRNKTTTETVMPTPIINFITSKGIKIFDKDFQFIPENLLGNIKAGDEIIIGVETIPTADIDRARIRVNKDKWENEDITLNYSEKQKIYYIKYRVASDESKLKIEAQLHSSSDGWLGD